MPTLATSSTEARTREAVTTRLNEEFLTVPIVTVERCVDDVWACAEHLGVDVTPVSVELIAREHLLALVNSSPPGRR
ncbi:hypothetical protein [Herbidospora mongoliensis]|uniref:hypothetical protein n=1 Tax=Herbidospora mongoliensis TaxID=688067 RepID=UPI00082E8C73|nr:hypothetical protein [Herbidospora mongoliensis]